MKKKAIAGIKMRPSVIRQSGLSASAMVQSPPKHQAARPAGVQAVQPLGLVRLNMVVTIGLA